jgi:hypothetical protein
MHVALSPIAASVEALNVAVKPLQTANGEGLQIYTSYQIASNLVSSIRELVGNLLKLIGQCKEVKGLNAFGKELQTIHGGLKKARKDQDLLLSGFRTDAQLLDVRASFIDLGVPIPFAESQYPNYNIFDITSYIVYLLYHLLTLRRTMPQDRVHPWDVAEAAETRRALLPTILQVTKKDAWQDIRKAWLRLPSIFAAIEAAFLRADIKPEVATFLNRFLVSQRAGLQIIFSRLVSNGFSIVAGTAIQSCYVIQLSVSKLPFIGDIYVFDDGRSSSFKVRIQKAIEFTRSKLDSEGCSNRPL